MRFFHIVALAAKWLWKDIDFVLNKMNVGSSDKSVGKLAALAQPPHGRKTYQRERNSILAATNLRLQPPQDFQREGQYTTSEDQHM
ncbi:UNVERIFIED_CONTAM: hypothetical protein K2H54_058602 [Gekko kuhli]